MAPFSSELDSLSSTATVLPDILPDVENSGNFSGAGAGVGIGADLLNPSTPLRREVAGCACPECGAPMAVRRWLMTADCWRCEVSISLAYVQQVVERPRKVRPRLAAKPQAVPPPFVVPKRSRWPANLSDLVACLLSVAAHLMLLILLALATLGHRDPPGQIRLSLEIDPRRVEGGMQTDHSIEHVGFRLPVEEPPPRKTNPRELEALQWAEQLQVSKEFVGRDVPKVSQVKKAVESNDQYRRMVAARDPRIRLEMIRQEGGTTLTEAAVARALQWIVAHQKNNGSWSLNRFHKVPSCRGRCGDPGHIHSGPGGTALALQALLGAGQTHRLGRYQESVAGGLRYLLSIQHHNGDLRGDTRANAGMYAHALAAIALCDALALTGDSDLRLPAQAAIDFIESSQHQTGGWRYAPQQAGDTSVVGWQLMALHSARAAGLEISERTLVAADAYLDSAQTDARGSYYSYKPGGRPTAAMTAEGLLSRMYLGWQKHDRGLQKGVYALATEYPPDRREPNIYYWYYGTQVMHHWGGRLWDQWNWQMREMLVSTQETRGHEAGSWEPETPHGHQGGRLYMTALACCTLEVYYRHAPLYRKIRLE